jgi:hypothetical protein
MRLWLLSYVMLKLLINEKMYFPCYLQNITLRNLHVGSLVSFLKVVSLAARCQLTVTQFQRWELFTELYEGSIYRDNFFCLNWDIVSFRWHLTSCSPFPHKPSITTPPPPQWTLYAVTNWLAKMFSSTWCGSAKHGVFFLAREGIMAG